MAYSVFFTKYINTCTEYEFSLGTISDNGGVANPACGSGYSVPIKKGLSFFCHPSLYGRYVTIRSLKRNNGLLVCEVEVYSERRGKLHNLYFLCLYQ